MRFILAFLMVASFAECASAQALAKGEKTLRVALEDADNRPFTFVDNKKWTGFHVEVVENVAQSLNWKVEWRPVIWTKTYNMLYNGEIDAICFLMKTPNRPETHVLFLDDNILNYFKIYLYARQDPPLKTKIDKRSVSQLAQHSVGVINGGIADRWTTMLHPEVVLNRTPKDSYQLFEMLDKKRFDFALALNFSYDVAIATNPDLKKEIQVFSSPLLIAPAYMAFNNSRNTYKSAEEFGKALVAFKKTRAYEGLRTKYGMK